MSARTIAKYAAVLGVGIGGGYFKALTDATDYLALPPTFANLEAKPPPKPREFDWGPVVQWDYNWDQRNLMVIL